jgi:hypothetical protein
MSDLNLSPLLKVSARLLDLHDSRRGPGESTQYQNEERPGLGDGRYFAIASVVLSVLQDFGKRSGDEYSSLTAIFQGVQGRLPWANESEIEYALNVLSRPSELKLLHEDGDGESHVIGDKETNLTDKAAHISEFRLSKIGKTALSMAMDNTDITYIEGDVIKLTRALESGRLAQALGFVDRLIEQLRTEHLALITLIERTSGGRQARPGSIDDLESYAATMRRAADLVGTAQTRIDDIARSDKPRVDDDVPLGLIRERVRELSRGIVRYAREITLLATQTLSATTTTVKAPSFADLAIRWVKSSPSKTQVETILEVMGPAFPIAIIPMGTDYQGLVKERGGKSQATPQIALSEYEMPIGNEFIEWLKLNQIALNASIQDDGLSIQSAIEKGLADMDGASAFNCLVAAITSPDEWVGDEVDATLETGLQKSRTAGLDVMYSGLQIKKRPRSGPTEEMK